MSEQIIKLDKSVVVACDVSYDQLPVLIRETNHNPKIGAYKIGFELALSVGLPAVVDEIRRFSEKPTIYDHQKAGTDIPDTGMAFAKVLKQARVDAAILFPFSGTATMDAWINALNEQKIGVIVGGHMTHKQFLWNEGGFLHDAGPDRIYRRAAWYGVTDFVMPGNKPDLMDEYLKQIYMQKPNIKPVVYSPGFVAQGGEITATARKAGPRWHAIIGRAIYDAADIAQAADEMTSQIEEK